MAKKVGKEFVLKSKFCYWPVRLRVDQTKNDRASSFYWNPKHMVPPTTNSVSIHNLDQPPTHPYRSIYSRGSLNDLWSSPGTYQTVLNVSTGILLRNTPSFEDFHLFLMSALKLSHHYLKIDDLDLRTRILELFGRLPQLPDNASPPTNTNDVH